MMIALSFLFVLCCISTCFSSPVSISDGVFSSDVSIGRNHNEVRCLDEERNALLHFKKGLIDEGNLLASWVAENRNCCTWVGISCDTFTGHVHGINLRGFHGLCYKQYWRDQYRTVSDFEEIFSTLLRGDISPSLLDLKHLNHLDLSCNNFEGIQIPNFIGSFPNLSYLDLSYCLFSGSLPPQLGNLSELRVLRLSHNILTSTGSIKWLRNLRLLNHLNINYVNLTLATDWFDVISNLPSLDQLHVRHCKFPHEELKVPSSNLMSLSVLDISFNHLDSMVVQWIFSMASLVSLDISLCTFNGITPGKTYSFRNLTSLKFLSASQTSPSIMNSSLVLKELSHSKIVSLDISDSHISSSHLNSLRNLTSLRILDLRSNELTERLPKSLGNLCNLRYLYLSFNNFANTSLTDLLESFMGCKFPALKSLMLAQSHISGPIPYSIAHLSSLENLFLSDNQLNGSLPVSIGQLSKLIDLDISENSLTGVVTQTHFQKLVSLKHLDGDGNRLVLRLQDEKWIPPFQMKYLNLNSWALGPKFPLWLQSQKNLTQLHVGNTGISSPMPNSFVRAFPKLHVLQMPQNNIKGALTTLLGFSSKLEVINISSNEFFGPLEPFLCYGGANQIFYLFFGNNNLSGVIPECWDNWLSLKILSLENNNVVGRVPKALFSLPSLELLNLYGNKLSGELPASVTNQTMLSFLHLGSNELVGTIPTWIGTAFPLLKSINLRNNKFDGNIPNELCYLLHVQIIDLAQNNLSGNIPSCFNNLSVLSGREEIWLFNFPNDYYVDKRVVNLPQESLVTKARMDNYLDNLIYMTLLDLSCNNLVGHIPSELTSLQQLKSLNLSGNQIEGKIPEQIGDMKEIESLDLSINKLSGSLPLSLTRLNFLSSFNVSYNNLTGRIPASTQIQSFNYSCFIGNKLCGLPLTNVYDCVASNVNVTAAVEKKKDDGSERAILIGLLFGGFCTGYMIMSARLIIRRIKMKIA